MTAISQPYNQDLIGCTATAIGEYGLSDAAQSRWLSATGPVMARLREDYRTANLPLLRIPEDTADLDKATAALKRLSEGASTLVFFGTGGSALGGQTLAQIGGWSLPGITFGGVHARPRVRFYDNLDPVTLQGALDGLDMTRTRFIVTSKSGGTTETLVQAMTAISAVMEAGLEASIPKMFLGLTEPAVSGKSNGLRALLEGLGVPILPHHTGVGGRFSCLTTVGLLPAMARGLDAYAVRAGARDVVDQMNRAPTPSDFAPAAGAATSVALSKHCGIRTFVMMPYSDRLGKFSEWFVQLWAESLGKGGEGTTPVAAVGPLDQHSQLQLFMDGPREIAVTIVRVASSGRGPVIDKSLARAAGLGFMGGKTAGDVVDAQAHAVAEALTKAGRPVRTIDVPKLDERAAGALLMHFMLETIIAGRLLDVDPFDQPAVELAKILTKQRLSSTH